MSLFRIFLRTRTINDLLSTIASRRRHKFVVSNSRARASQCSISRISRNASAIPLKYIYPENSPKASVKSLSTVPQVLQTRSEFETEVLIVSRYIVAAHRGNAFLLGRVLALRVASHRLRRAARCRRCITRQGIVVVRRGWTSPTVLAAGRFHVEHGRVRLDVRINLKATSTCSVLGLERCWNIETMIEIIVSSLESCARAYVETRWSSFELVLTFRAKIILPSSDRASMNVTEMMALPCWNRLPVW